MTGSDRMDTSELHMHVGGQWIGSSSGRQMTVHSPVTGKEVARVPHGTRADVGRAVAAARAAQPSFAKLTPFARAKLCHRVADVIASRREALARQLTLEQGKPMHAEALG